MKFIVLVMLGMIAGSVLVEMVLPQATKDRLGSMICWGMMAITMTFLGLSTVGLLIATLREVPPVPTTSIYSRSDGIVAWQCSINDDSPLAENIEVHASHIGMGMNPLAMFAIADRLRQDPAQWQRFDAQGARRWFYKTTGMAPFAAVS